MNPFVQRKNFLEVLAEQTDWNEREKYTHLRDARETYKNHRITNELLKQYYDRAKAEHDASFAEKQVKYKKTMEEMERAHNERVKEYEERDQGDVSYEPFKVPSLNSSYDKAPGKTQISESHKV